MRRGPHAARLTRKITSEWLASVEDPTAGNAALLAGEMVRAVQRQSRLSVRLGIEVAGDAISIRVADDTSLPSPMVGDDAGAVRLQSMLERACTRWGCSVGRAHREMWATLRRE